MLHKIPYEHIYPIYVHLLNALLGAGQGRRVKTDYQLSPTLIPQGLCLH